jgi:hypothetical protein
MISNHDLPLVSPTAEARIGCQWQLAAQVVDSLSTGPVETITGSWRMCSARLVLLS